MLRLGLLFVCERARERTVMGRKRLDIVSNGPFHVLQRKTGKKKGDGIDAIDSWDRERVAGWIGEGKKKRMSLAAPRAERSRKGRFYFC